MIKALSLIMLLIALISLSTCKKKTNIKVRAFNYAMNEPITDAKIVLLQTNINGGLFNARYSCKIIAEATVNSEGYCYFDEAKLRKSKSYEYACKISYAYGRVSRYNCDPTETSKIEVGKTNDKVIHNSNYDAYLQVKYINLLNPSISGDSLIVGISAPVYRQPNAPYPLGGGGAFSDYNSNDDPQYPFANLILSGKYLTTAGRNILRIRKRKMGVLTTSIDTIKIQPYETKIIEVVW